MKKLIFLLIPLLIFWGCASSPKNSEQGMAAVEKNTEQASVENAAAESETPRIIEIQVPHILKQTRYFRDGSIDTWMEYGYEEGTDILVSRKHFQADGSVLAEYIFENEGRLAIKRTDLTGDGKIIGYELYKYNSTGDRVQKSAFDAEDNLQLVSEYTFDTNGNREKLTIKDGNSGLLSYIVYKFVGNREASSELFGADGKRTNYFEKEYDSEGLLVRQTDYTNEGRIEGIVEKFYENGYCVSEEHKNQAGGLVRKYLYENDQNGTPVIITLQNKKGIVLERQELSYFYTIEAVPAE